MRVGLIGTGAFGREVNMMLSAQGHLETEDLSRLLPRLAMLPSSIDAAVAVMWRSSEQMCERLDAAAFAVNLPWMPVIFDHPYITVGPWIVPPGGPCFRCLVMRQAQHDAPERVEKYLREAYDADPELGPRGHLACHIRLTAGLILRAVSMLPSVLASGSVTAPSGNAELVIYQVESGRLEVSRLVACHGCERCGQGPDPADPQYRLKAALGSVMAGSTANRGQLRDWAEKP